jgi:azurin
MIRGSICVEAWRGGRASSLIQGNVLHTADRYAGPVMDTRHLVSVTVLVSLTGFTLGACGGAGAPAGDSATASSGAASATSRGPAASAPSPAPAAVHDGRPIEITADDTMKFSTVEIRAKAGERLSVTLTNKGTAPKFSMGHNWVLLASHVDRDAFLAAAGEAPATDYVPAGRRGDILASTKLLGPGEHDTVTFAAPAAGRYPFFCSFPGHAQVGMQGVLIVE